MGGPRGRPFFCASCFRVDGCLDCSVSPVGHTSAPVVLRAVTQRGNRLIERGSPCAMAPACPAERDAAPSPYVVAVTAGGAGPSRTVPHAISRFAGTIVAGRVQPHEL